jgi:hypothetical protein
MFATRITLNRPALNSASSLSAYEAQCYPLLVSQRWWQKIVLWYSELLAVFVLIGL